MKPDLQAIREAALKAEQEEWILGGCSGRMITTPSGYVGDGYIADVDTKANANHIATSNPQTVLALLAYIARLEASRQWVPVSERLPEDKKIVDIWIKKFDIREIEYTYIADAKAFINLTNKYPTKLSEVSYWRYSNADRPLSPLPEVPE